MKTWPLGESAEAYQTVLDGSAGIKQVLLPAGRTTNTAKLAVWETPAFVR